MTPQPIATAPKDRPILVYGICAWERLDPAGKPGWRVVEWTDHLTTDDDCEWIGGWKSITCHPYKDFVIAEKWVELPS